MNLKNKICLFGMVSPLFVSAVPQEEIRPNFVLLLTDDQSYHMSLLNVPGLKTPNMDHLARNGVFFTKAYSTTASCAPSRVSILTGMYPHSNGEWRNTIGPTVNEPDIQFSRQSTKADKVGVHEDISTLIEVLNENGYFTGITEKWHLSPPWKFPFDFRGPAGLTPAGNAKAVDKFLHAAGEKPFFLQVNIDNTHRPFRKHVEQNKNLPAVNPDELEIPPCWPDTPGTRKDYAEYLTTVQHADAVIGAVFQTLEKAGTLKNTIIIFTSDQGFCYTRAKATAYDWGVHVPLSFTGPGVKNGVVLPSLASLADLMPTVLDYAGIPVPKTVQGQSLRPILEGRAESVAGRRFVVSEHNAHGPRPQEYYPTRSITDGRYRYVRNLRHDIVPDFPIDRYAIDPEFREKPKAPAWMPWDATPSERWQNNAFAEIIENKDKFPKQYELLKATFFRPEEELYDLKNDPYETDNLAGNPEYKSTMSRLSQALDDWMKKTDDIGDPRSIERRDSK